MTPFIVNNQQRNQVPTPPTFNHPRTSVPRGDLCIRWINVPPSSSHRPVPIGLNDVNSASGAYVGEHLASYRYWVSSGPHSGYPIFTLLPDWSTFRLHTHTYVQRTRVCTVVASYILFFFAWYCTPVAPLRLSHWRHREHVCLGVDERVAPSCPRALSDSVLPPQARCERNCCGGGVAGSRFVFRVPGNRGRTTFSNSFCAVSSDKLSPFIIPLIWSFMFSSFCLPTIWLWTPLRFDLNFPLVGPVKHQNFFIVSDQYACL